MLLMNRNRLMVGAFVLILIIVGVGAIVKKEAIRQTYRTNLARRTYNHELNALQGSLARLGIDKQSKTRSGCSRGAIYGYAAPQLQCIVQAENYIVTDGAAHSKTAVLEKARELDAALKNNGWNTSSNSAENFAGWFQGILDGKDYLGDINSVKNTKDSHCTLGFNVAYSNPKPVAFAIRLSCSSPVLVDVKDNALFL